MKLFESCEHGPNVHRCEYCSCFHGTRWEDAQGCVPCRIETRWRHECTDPAALDGFIGPSWPGGLRIAGEAEECFVGKPAGECAVALMVLMHRVESLIAWDGANTEPDRKKWRMFMEECSRRVSDQITAVEAAAKAAGS